MTDEAGPARFGAALAAARKRRGLNVRQASQRAGISEGRWRQLELGYQQAAGGVRIPANPKSTTVRAVATAVGLDLVSAFEAVGLPVPDDVLAGPQVEVDRPSVGARAQDAEDALFRLPPGLTPRQRENALRIAQGAIREYLATLEDEED
jgi:transcriptional regulator with XRE-family HTH domain